MILCFIGTTELILIGGLALLLVGGKKLPEMMRGLGKGVREFKDGMNEPNEPKTNDSLPANEQNSQVQGQSFSDQSKEQ
ncbi:MAG: twin-arginine translocase TatA/TatE family subunit [Muribaculaceae bacterium]|nr:twin-arginine translocase TatA/TatE family subunit [Muribaculaceae bacterium]